MMTQEIFPARRLRGDIEVPGDKSIGHRVALIGAISEGTTSVSNFPSGLDCVSTLECLEGLGISINRDGNVLGDTLQIEGKGLGGLTAPSSVLNAGNSGTTIRLLSGILAGNSFTSTLVGDESLSQRPMSRIVQPLESFGAQFETTAGHLPMTITGGRLKAIDYELPFASAQVKSALLLAGIHATGTTVVREPLRTRDHTEIALKAAGAALRVIDEPNEQFSHMRRIEVDGGCRLQARSVRVPGDLSSAAFLIAAGILVPNSELRLSGVGVNPSRTDFLSVIREIGGSVQVESPRVECGEAIADIVVNSSSLRAIDLPASASAGLIDELPILAVLGVCGAGRTMIRGAGELRHKETDRIHALAVNLEAIGATVKEFEDGLSAECSGTIEGGTVSSFGDHRIAMAFAVAGLVSNSGIRIENSDCVGISFPDFFELLESLIDH